MTKVTLSVVQLMAIGIFSWVCIVACKGPLTGNSTSQSDDSPVVADFKQNPSGVTNEAVISQTSLGQSLKNIYNRGCISSGDPTAILVLDPHLQSGDSFVVERHMVKGTAAFTAKYDLVATALPTSAYGPVVLTGVPEVTDLKGYLGAVYFQDNQSVTRTCSVLNIQSKIESCTDITGQYTDQYQQFYNQSFSADGLCSMIPVTDPAVTPRNQESWSQVQYQLAGGTTVPAFIHRVFKVYVRSCENLPTPRTVVQVNIDITSNAVKATRYNYCGGEPLFTKTSIWDDNSKTMISDSEYKVDLIPVINSNQ